MNDDPRRELEYRLRQQVLISELGLYALRYLDFDALLQEATRLTAEGLQAKFSKVLEYLPGENRLLVRAGVGWAEGTVGAATVGGDLESPAGYALHTGKPVISNHLAKERRFRTPELLAEHGITRAINVIIPNSNGKPFGVLEVDNPDGNAFTPHDISFLQAAANVLGAAIERRQAEEALQAAVQEKDMLMREAHHRITNSLSIVSSMILMQSRHIEDPAVRNYLVDTSKRVVTVGRVHERLYGGSTPNTVEFGQYLRDLCEDLRSTLGDEDGRPSLKVEAAKVELATSKAVPLALIANELVTNAFKYVHSAADRALVEVGFQRQAEGQLQLTVADNGAGLPDGFDPAAASGLGMKLVLALSKQLDGQLDIGDNGPGRPGARFTLRIPV